MRSPAEAGRCGGPGARSLDGYPFAPDADVWILDTPSGPCRFNFVTLHGASDGLRAHAKSALAVLVSSRPPEWAHTGLSLIRSLLRSIVLREPRILVERFTAADLQGYQAGLAPGSRYLAGRLRDFLLAWAETGAGGLGADLLEVLPWMQTERYAAGNAVRTCSPTHGALTIKQRDAVLTALHAAHAAGTIRLDDYGIALLILVLALRPLQVGCVKTQDLLPASDTGEAGGDLLVTLLKQKGTRPRDAFTKIAVISEIFGVLCSQRRVAVAWAATRGIAADEAPLFPDRGHASRRPERLKGFEGHLSRRTVAKRLRRTLDRLGVLPELAGGGHVFPLRCRRTLATHQYAEGRSLTEISALLTQKGRAQALSYIEQPPELIERLDAALGETYARFANGFLRPPACPIDPARAPGQGGYGL